MRDFLRSGDNSYLIECPDFWGKASVHTQHLAVNDGGQSEEIEDLAAGLPDTGVAIFLLAFFVEAVYLGDLTGFVVASDEGNFVRESMRWSV